MPCISAKQAELARATPLAGRVTIRYPEAAVMSGIPVSKLQELVSTGELASVKIGRARLIRVQSLLALLEGRATPRRRRR